MNAFFRHRAWLFIWGIPFVVLIAWAGGWWFTALVAVLSALAARELMRAMLPMKPGPGVLALVGGLLVLLPVAVMLNGVAAFLFVLVAGVIAIGSIALTYPPEQGYRILIAGAFSLLYIGVPFTSLLLIRNDPAWVTRFDGAAIVLYLWGGVWVADTFAYLVGKRFGKRKLAPQLSPGKTIEGTFGGVAFALLWAIGVGMLLGDTLTWTDRVLLGLIIGVMAVIGDLVESMIKRVAQVKDSGTVFLGHGGVLDRFDSLFFVQPAAYLYLIASGVLTTPAAALFQLPG